MNDLPTPEEMDEMFKQLQSPQKQTLEDFFDNDYFFNFKMKINKEVIFIKRMDVNKSVKGAYLSACIKRQKRSIVKDYILKIALIEKIDLTQRMADLFFIECLGRSVGEFYLNENFAGLQYNNNELIKIKRTSKTILLNPAIKEKLNEIIEKYKKQIIESIEKIKNYFYEAKNA